jgi:hypothetical protein
MVNFTKDRGAAKHGAGRVERNIALLTTTLKLVNGIRMRRIIIIPSVVKRKLDSNKKTIVLEDTVAIAENAGTRSNTKSKSLL